MADGSMRSYHYFPQGLPRLQVPSGWASRLFQTLVWTVAVGGFGWIALRSCERLGEQGIHEMSQAIRSIEIKTNTVSGNQEINTANPAQAQAHDTLTRQYQQLQQELASSKKNAAESLKNWEVLQASYQNEQRLRQAAEKQLLTAIKDAANRESVATKETTKTDDAYDSLIKALHREFIVEQLTAAEKDFYQPLLADNGNYFLFYDDKQLSNNKLQKSLKVGMLEGSDIKVQELFQTKEIKEKQGEIPFFYSWDGGENVAILTRIEGENVIQHVRFQLAGTKWFIVPPRKIVAAAHPEVLGAPAISPNGQLVAFLHKTGTDLMVKVHQLKDGKLLAQTIGGGDTSKVPAWSPDSKTLFFLTLDQKGILAWKFTGQEKSSKLVSEEIYGRYLTCSPDGTRLAFFQRSSEGKGKVNLCTWELLSSEKSEVKTLQSNFWTAESCRPSWGASGNFLAIIHTGPEEKLVIQELESLSLFTVFSKAGKIEWLDWSAPNLLMLTYKEGLFTRPYRVRFTSFFAK